MPSPIMLPRNRPGGILLCKRVARYFLIRKVFRKLSYCFRYNAGLSARYSLRPLISPGIHHSLLHD